MKDYLDNLACAVTALSRRNASALGQRGGGHTTANWPSIAVLEI